MDETELLFTLFYILLCMVIAYPPEEFQRMGLTIEKLFARYLGNEQHYFIKYHQKRTAINLFVISALPIVYFIIFYIKFTLLSDVDGHEDEQLFSLPTLLWKVSRQMSLMALLTTPALIAHWSLNNWEKHPISQNLQKFANSANENYEAIASSIGIEIRRPDIYKKKLNAISSVLATENWIIKISLFNVYFAHQSDTSLKVIKSDTYNITPDSNDTLQMLNIAVKSLRNGVSSFNIRINAEEFRNLENRLSRPISIPSNIQFHRNVMERFIDCFKEQVAMNAVFKADRIADKCFACMATEPNVKIHKQCIDAPQPVAMEQQQTPLANNAPCTNCYCRPMWCVECLARWFAARQNDYDQDVWLEQKCTCPMCRAKFCVLDVSYIQRVDAEGNAISAT